MRLTRRILEASRILQLHLVGHLITDILRGIEIAPPMEQDVERIGAILRKRISPVNIVVLRSGDQRFLVVAGSFEITENQWDIFESPIEFRSHFRAK